MKRYALAFACIAFGALGNVARALEVPPVAAEKADAAIEEADALLASARTAMARLLGNDGKAVEAFVAEVDAAANGNAPADAAAQEPPTEPADEAGATNDAGAGKAPEEMPPGWAKGKKKGWRGRGLPPGLAKKDWDAAQRDACSKDAERLETAAAKLAARRDDGKAQGRGRALAAAAKALRERIAELDAAEEPAAPTPDGSDRGRGKGHDKDKNKPKEKDKGKKGKK